MNTIVDQIRTIVAKSKIEAINLMEVCGTHTMAIGRSGIRGMMPEQLQLLSGPGCPVCVTSQETIDYAVALAQEKDIIITTFGDMVRVPGSRMSLEHFSPSIIYSALDALTIAADNPKKDVVFIGVGFETTSPTVAAAIMAAEKRKLKNFYVLPAFKLIPPALEYIAQSPKINVQGFILPGHVSTIIGSRPYEFIAANYGIPGCITGFEPLDILQGILNLVQQVTQKKAYIAIEYTKVVKPEGNKKAQEILNTVFQVSDARWRGIGTIKKSGLTLNHKYTKYDVRNKYRKNVRRVPEPRGCMCGKVLLGIKIPSDCALFGQKCTPQSPIGPCMVSSEGACAAYYKYGGHKEK